jgi:hypothetical protein
MRTFMPHPDFSLLSLFTLAKIRGKKTFLVIVNKQRRSDE